MKKRVYGPRWGPDFPCVRYVLTVREFLLRVAAEVGGEATPRSPDALLWDRFIPTTIRLVSELDDDAVALTSDVDALPNPKFVTGIKTVQCVRYYASARIQQVSARSFLVLPALEPERRTRRVHLANRGYPLRIGDGVRDHVAVAYQRLTHREQVRLHFIPSDERVALAAILVARHRPVAAFSSDGLWPRHPLVCEVAQRTGCRIVRRPLDEIPTRVQRQIRFLRYVPQEPMS